jgi:hypothetical protein|nr:MAG TPA: hypothetical protein [Caudoviricetes sp.]
MANDFLEKSIDLSKVDLIITFPGIGTYMIKEAKEIINNATEDSHTMGEPDIKGNVPTIQTRTTKREIKVKTIKGSDDDIFLTKCNKNPDSKLGTCTYIDNTGMNKIVGEGRGLSIQKGGERTNNTKDVDIEYIIQCAKYDEKV